VAENNSEDNRHSRIKTGLQLLLFAENGNREHDRVDRFHIQGQRLRERGQMP